MRLITQLCFSVMLALSFLGTAVAAESMHYTQGKEYVKIKDLGLLHAREHGKVTVYEFFNYGCPWCYKLDPYLEKWLAHKPANVDFERVPVQFNEAWTMYARAYYVAKALGIEHKFTPDIFNALHAEQLIISNKAQLEAFFVPKYATKQQFESAFEYSPGIDQDMARSKNLMLKYQIMSVPTIIVGAQYKTDNVMAKGDNQRLIDIINYLIKLSAHKSETSKSTS